MASNNMARWCWFLYKNALEYRRVGEEDKARELAIRLVDNAWAPRYVQICSYQLLAIIAPEDITARAFLDNALSICNRLLDRTDRDRELNLEIKAHILSQIDICERNKERRIANLTPRDSNPLSDDGKGDDNNKDDNDKPEDKEVISGLLSPPVEAVPDEAKVLEGLDKMHLD